MVEIFHAGCLIQELLNLLMREVIYCLTKKGNIWLPSNLNLINLNQSAYISLSSPQLFQMCHPVSSNVPQQRSQIHLVNNHSWIFFSKSIICAELNLKNAHETLHSPSPRTFPIESRVLMIITSWSLDWSSSLIPRFATVDRSQNSNYHLLKNSMNINLLLLFLSILNKKHTCDCYCCAVVRSVVGVQDDRLWVFFRSKFPPADRDKENKIKWQCLEDYTMEY